MDITSINHTMSLVYRIFDSKHSTVPIIKTEPQKPAFRTRPIEQPFERATPESQSIPSRLISAFLSELAGDKTLNMHSLMILRNGRVICETGFGERELSHWKCTYSACKSVVSLAVGMLIDEGRLRLGDRLVDIFTEQTTALGRIKLKDLTVSNLLTMTSTVKFNELRCMTETDWVKSFLSSPTKGDIGKTFCYNSLNTYMLSAAVKAVSGEGLTQYLEPRLFRPLGIRDVFWEKCPEGIEKGGWGLFIRPEDLAKIGQLVLQNGSWRGAQLISKAWIKKATSAHMHPPESLGDYDYGYQIWVGRKQNSFLFNGMFGQNVLGIRDNGLLLVTSAGNDETFQQGAYFTLVHKYFTDTFDEKLGENPRDFRELKELLKSLGPTPEADKPRRQLQRHAVKRIAPLPGGCAELCKKTLAADGSKTASVGLLPVVLQATQNNYTKGLRSLSFSVENGRFFVSYNESDEAYKFAAGFDCAEKTDLLFHGEPYAVSAVAGFARDEDGNEVLKLRIDFLETPCTRFIKIYFANGGARLRQTELPGKKFMLSNLASLKEELEKRPMIANALSKLDTDLLDYKVERTFEPSAELEIKPL